MTAESATGSIARAARMLAALADAPGGVALTDLMASTAFTKTTTHRVLASLQDVHYVTQDPEDRTYHLGSQLAALARKAAHVDLSVLAGQAMKRLASLTEDTVFLSVPEGASSVCIAREIGAFPIRTLTLDRGDRRPLGIGAGAQALYCAMPATRRAAVARANQDWLAEYNMDHAKLEALCAGTTARGYAINQGNVIPGMSAVGLPVIAASGRLVAGLAIGAITDRMTPDRVEGLIVPALRKEAALLAKQIDELESEGRHEPQL